MSNSEADKKRNQQLLDLSTKIKQINEKVTKLNNLVSELKSTHNTAKADILAEISALKTSLQTIINDLTLLSNQMGVIESGIKSSVDSKVNEVITKVESIKSELMKIDEKILQNITILTDKLDSNHQQLLEKIKTISVLMNRYIFFVDFNDQTIIHRNIVLKKGHKYKVYFKGLDLLDEFDRVTLDFSDKLKKYLTSTEITLTKEGNSVFLVGDIAVEKPVGKLETLTRARHLQGFGSIYLYRGNEKIFFDSFPVNIAGIDFYVMLALGSVLYSLIPLISAFLNLTLPVSTIISAMLAVISLYMIIGSLINILK